MTQPYGANDVITINGGSLAGGALTFPVWAAANFSGATVTAGNAYVFAQGGTSAWLANLTGSTAGASTKSRTSGGFASVTWP